jgi:hypothetical protein
MKTDREKAQAVYEKLSVSYKKMVDSFNLEELISHCRAEIKSLKKLSRHEPLKYFSLEKIHDLEKALAELETVYEAEKAEAEKMPFSWHEAKKVQKMIDEVRDS